MFLQKFIFLRTVWSDVSGHPYNQNKSKIRRDSLQLIFFVRIFHFLFYSILFLITKQCPLLIGIGLFHLLTIQEKGSGRTLPLHWGGEHKYFPGSLQERG